MIFTHYSHISLSNSVFIISIKRRKLSNSIKTVTLKQVQLIFTCKSKHKVCMLCPKYTRLCNSCVIKWLLEPITCSSHVRSFVPVVTSPIWVWLSMLLLPACCWPCMCKPQSQKGSDQPESEHRAHLLLAPLLFCWIQLCGSHSEATAPSAGGNLEKSHQKINK